MPLRSFTSALETISHPCPSAPRRFSTGTRTSLMNTSLNSEPPSIWRIGRMSMPRLRMSIRSTERPPHLVRADAGQLLVEDRLLHRRESRAAVFLRPRGAEEPRGVQLPLPGAHRGEVARRAGLGKVRGEPPAHAGAEGLLGRGVGEIHRHLRRRILAERRRAWPSLWGHRIAARWLASPRLSLRVIRGGGGVLCSDR